jgi:intracellular multiplication protein IcmP
MSSNNNQGDPALLLLVMVLLFGGLGWLVWHMTKFFWMDHMFRWLRFGELWFINLFYHHYDSCLDWLRYARTNDANPSPGIISATQTCFGSDYLVRVGPTEASSYYMMSMPPLVALGAEAMRFYRWPMILVLAYIAVYALFYSPNNKFRTKHTLESFIATQAKMWPVISPIVKFNPSDTGRILGAEVPDKLPLFAEPLSPEEWVSWNRIPVVNGIPDRDATRRAFIQQLGPRWTSIDSVPPHIKALLATFALRGAQKREESDDLLGRLALSWSPDKGLVLDGALTAEINRIIRDPELGGKIVPVCEQHAWRTTALLGVLRWARNMGGVLAPAQFLWLRGEDRALWYPMNNLGRRSYHSEGAGAMAHFMAEEAAKRPLPIPRVDTAIVTLNTYLHDPDKRPIPIPPREGAKA